MADKVIFIITHGYREYCGDPEMTPEGCDQIRALKSFLPDKIASVLTGTGRRHLQIADLLGLAPTRFSTVIGCADAIDKSGNYIVLPTGKMIPKSAYTTRFDMDIAPRQLVRKLPSMSIICSGQSFMQELGLKNAQNGCLYRLEVVSRRGGWEIIQMMPDGSEDRFNEFYMNDFM